MIWSILFFWLANSTNTILIPADINDYIKNDIQDETLKKELLDEIKLFEDELANFEKVKADWNNSLDMINIDYEEPTARVDSIFQDYIIIRTDFDVYAISAHLSLKSKISDEDWGNIIQNIDNSQKDLSKSQTKKKEAIAEDLDKIKRKIDMMVIAPEKRVLADSIFSEFEKSFLTYMDEVYSFNYQQNKILRNRTATEDEIKHLIFSIIEIRESIFQAYVKMNSDLYQVLEKTEWQRISRAINQMI